MARVVADGRCLLQNQAQEQRWVHQQYLQMDPSSHLVNTQSARPWPRARTVAALLEATLVCGAMVPSNVGCARRHGSSPRSSRSTLGARPRTGGSQHDECRLSPFPTAAGCPPASRSPHDLLVYSPVIQLPGMASQELLAGMYLTTCPHFPATC